MNWKVGRWGVNITKEALKLKTGGECMTPCSYSGTTTECVPGGWG